MTSPPLITAVLSSLSHALDITEGHPRGHATRTAMIGLEIAERLGLDEASRMDLLYALLLKDAGCSANASRVYELFGGPEHEVKRAVWVRDWRKLTEQARYVLGYAGRGSGLTGRLKKLIRLARLGPPASRELFQLRCARGAQIAHLMELGPDVAHAIRCMDEHWDGGGHPAGLRGEEIPIYAQIIGLAQVMEIYWGADGERSAVDVARARTGTWFSPRLTSVAGSLADDPGFWRRIRTVEDGGPAPLLEGFRNVRPDPLTGEALERIATAFALIIDGKSPFTADHSRRVARYAAAIARRMGLDDAEIVRLHRAGLVHDLGKLAIPNSILEKPAALDEAEWRKMREHPRLTWELLRAAPGFEEVALDAASHHERMDGTGYHQGLRGDALSIPARILAVADVTDALAAERPYREGLGPEKVMEILEAGAGTHLCPSCVEVCTPDLVANVGEAPAPVPAGRVAARAGEAR